NGGGIIHIAGTLTASPLSVTPGDTVTITGAGILPPLFEEIRVTFDGVEVPGSPTSLIPPDGGLDVDVVVPLVSNGPHIIEVQGTYDAGTRVIRVTLASFTATVSGGLATTGAADAGGLGFGAALLLVGGGVLFGTARARWRHASILGG